MLFRSSSPPKNGYPLLLSAQKISGKDPVLSQTCSRVRGWLVSPAASSRTEKEVSSQKSDRPKMSSRERTLKGAFSCGTWGHPGRRHGCFRAWVIKCSQHSSGKKILALLLTRIMKPQGHLILPGAATQESPGEGRLQAPGQGQ